MNTCSDCAHSIFCDSWGEWKCVLYKKRVRYPELLDCPGYEKKKKDAEEKNCRCPTCEERERTEE